MAATLWRLENGDKTNLRSLATLAEHEQVLAVVEQECGKQIGVGELCRKLRSNGFKDLAAQVSSNHRGRKQVAHPPVALVDRLKSALKTIQLASSDAEGSDVLVADTQSSLDEGAADELSVPNQPNQSGDGVCRGDLKCDMIVEHGLNDIMVKIDNLAGQVDLALSGVSLLLNELNVNSSEICHAGESSIKASIQEYFIGDRADIGDTEENVTFDSAITDERVPGVTLQCEGGDAEPRMLNVTSAHDSIHVEPFSKKSQDIDDDNAVEAEVAHSEAQWMTSHQDGVDGGCIAARTRKIKMGFFAKSTCEVCQWLEAAPPGIRDHEVGLRLGAKLSELSALLQADLFDEETLAGFLCEAFDDQSALKEKEWVDGNSG